MPMSKKYQNTYEKKITMNVIQHDDIYDRFTMEHFTLRQSMILTTSFFFCSRQYFTSVAFVTFSIILES
jgi:hypothetical protein